MVKTFLCLLLFLSLPVAAASSSVTQAQVIKLASTEWCPYACENSHIGKGIVYDYLTMLLKPKGIEIQLVFLPWVEAVDAVRTGQADGLLTAIKSEAPNLVFTNTPTMHYKMCFFVENNDAWRYQGVASLESKHLAIIQNYGYGEPVDSYVRELNNVNKFTVFRGDNSLKRLTSILANDKPDVFIEDAYVVNWQKRDLTTETFKQAGCLRPIPFYMAFNHEFAERTGIISTLDSVLSQIKYKTYLNQFMLPHYFSSSSSNWHK